MQSPPMRETFTWNLQKDTSRGINYIASQFGFKTARQLQRIFKMKNQY